MYLIYFIYSNQVEGGITLIIEINSQSATPIYEQLYDQVVFGIAADKLTPGEALPSTRSLAADLGINALTVNKAYAMLCSEGYIVMDRRKGAVVAQVVKNNDVFLARLSRRLILAAAEAICHNMSEDDYIGICAECYRNAKGNE